MEQGLSISEQILIHVNLFVLNQFYNRFVKRFHENDQNKLIFKTSFDRKDEVEALCFIFQDQIRNKGELE